MSQTIDRDHLTLALSTIAFQDEYTWSSRFLDLFAEVHVRAISQENLRGVYPNLQFINQDLWNIGTIVSRLEWQKQLWTNGDLSDQEWSNFAAADIDMFHVEFRSVFDYMAKIIKSLAQKPGQVPDSFHDLSDWAKKKGNPQRLGEDLAQLVVSCEWFHDIKDVRDSIVHRGGQTLVFPVNGRILFDVFPLLRKKSLAPELMYNQNVVDFELYAGLYLGYLIAYLEDFAAAVFSHLQISESKLDASSRSGGLIVIKKWIERVLCLDSTRASKVESANHIPRCHARN